MHRGDWTRVTAYADPSRTVQLNEQDILDELNARLRDAVVLHEQEKADLQRRLAASLEVTRI
jgi:hypothetical protein